MVKGLNEELKIAKNYKYTTVCHVKLDFKRKLISTFFIGKTDKRHASRKTGLHINCLTPQSRWLPFLCVFFLVTPS